MFEHAAFMHCLEKLREQKPLVLNLTNFVAQSINANVLLALGASPIMASDPREMPDLCQIAQSLVINIGTLNALQIEAITEAQQHAKARRLPIILDPVGAGASVLRTQTCLNILDKGVDVLRANASEILSLTCAQQNSKGVDATVQSQNAIASAKLLAKQFGCVVLISGATDYCVSAKEIISSERGDAMLTYVTAMGCSATALIGGFAASGISSMQAALMGVLSLNIAAEHAIKMADGPGTFVTHLLDKLYQLPHLLKQDLAVLCGPTDYI